MTHENYGERMARIETKLEIIEDNIKYVKNDITKIAEKMISYEDIIKNKIKEEVKLNIDSLKTKQAILFKLFWAIIIILLGMAIKNFTGI